jgi:hypothetical protein
MSLLPGVPNMSPAPVSPTIKIAGKANLGAPSGIAKVAQSAGKPGNTENFGSVVGRMGKGISNLGGGSQVAHSINHYGKSGPAFPGMQGLAGTSGVQPTMHAGAKLIRGTSMGKHIKKGGLGSGPQGMPGGNSPNDSGDPSGGGAPSSNMSMPNSGSIDRE